jgi:carbamate kinase
MTSENQRANVKMAAQGLAKIASGNELIITHGNGPQIGLLALQNAAYSQAESYPLDILDAETAGMIGYLIEQELGNILPPEQPFATVLTMIEVDPNDLAFQKPSKPIGPVYTQSEAEQLKHEKGWTIAPDGDRFRRVVPSPLPKRVFELRPIQWLLEKGAIIICAGGGGIPTIRNQDGKLEGVEAVIDKDRASALLAKELVADLLVMATDVDAVYLNWGKPNAKAIREISPKAIAQSNFAAGSMGPKVSAAVDFVQSTGKKAAIGALSQLTDILRGEAGTLITY